MLVHKDADFVRKHSDSQKQVLWRWRDKDAWVKFVIFWEKFPADSRHSKWDKLHISFFINSYMAQFILCICLGREKK